MGPKEREIFIAIALFVVVAALLLTYFFIYMYKLQQKLARYAEEKNNVTIAVSEMERNEIAVELHNDITPYLASVKMRIEMLNEGHEETIVKCVNVLENCIDRIRVMSKKLSPIGIYEQTFWIALEQFIAKTGVDLVFRVEFILLNKPELSFESHNQIYRILQEIILNAVKHSKASQLKIEISVENNILLIRTADDGVSFDEKSILSQNKQGLGLLNMQSRIDFLNGTYVKSDSSIPGTHYNIRIPV